MHKNNNKNPLIDDAKAKPNAPSGLISTIDNAMFSTSAYMLILAAFFCSFLAYNHNKKTLLSPNGISPTK